MCCYSWWLRCYVACTMCFACCRILERKHVIKNVQCTPSNLCQSYEISVFFIVKHQAYVHSSWMLFILLIWNECSCWMSKYCMHSSFLHTNAYGKYEVNKFFEDIWCIWRFFCLFICLNMHRLTDSLKFNFPSAIQIPLTRWFLRLFIIIIILSVPSSFITSRLQVNSNFEQTGWEEELIAELRLSCKKHLIFLLQFLLNYYEC